MQLGKGISPEKSILNVEAQKELVTHQAKTMFRYSMLTMLIIFPVIMITILGMIYFIFRFIGLIR